MASGDTNIGDISALGRIDLSSAKITAKGSSNLAGFDDPRSILNCTDGFDSLGKAWLLEDDAVGYWQAAQAPSTFKPATLRLSNAKQDGRGTKSFRFTYFPSNGLANLTYTDAQTGKREYSTTQCPLAPSSDKEYQDFLFINIITMNGFQLSVSEWYGAGGGLDGLVLADESKQIRSSNAFLMLMTVITIAAQVMRNAKPSSSTMSSTNSSLPTNSASTMQADPSNTASTVAATTTVTPPPSSSNKLSPGAKAGIAIAVVAFVLLLLGALLFWRRRSRVAHRNLDSASPPKDQHSEMGRQELAGNASRFEKDSGVQG